MAGHNQRLASAAIFLTAIIGSIGPTSWVCSATTQPTTLPSFAEPSLSPDGAEIAFVSGGDIWTVPSAGGEARLLVSHPSSESRPIYSPDGKPSGKSFQGAIPITPMPERFWQGLQVLLMVVLLFVMDPERDNWFHFRAPFFVGARQQIIDVRIDRGTVSLRLFHSRP